MKRNPTPLTLKAGIIIIFSCCSLDNNPYPSVGAIPPPAGYQRSTDKAPFSKWLHAIPLKKDRTVYLFNGHPKGNQDAQFAVLDVSVGHQDLQQCADAVMRLRAEYLYARKDYEAISFFTQQGVRLNFLEWTQGRRFRLSGSNLVAYSLAGSHKPCEDRACFDEYLQTVFMYCGTLSLEKQLIPKPHFGDIQPGDVLVRGGAPGHAMLVIDVAADAGGHKVFMLAQSYMPAQDIHIVKNPANGSLSPWYPVKEGPYSIVTPEWIFYSTQLYTWPKN